MSNGQRPSQSQNPILLPLPLPRLAPNPPVFSRLTTQCCARDDSELCDMEARSACDFDACLSDANMESLVQHDKCPIVSSRKSAKRRALENEFDAEIDAYPRLLKVRSPSKAYAAFSLCMRTFCLPVCPCSVCSVTLAHRYKLSAHMWHRADVYLHRYLLCRCA
jgi:hypothetical protein